MTSKKLNNTHKSTSINTAVDVKQQSFVRLKGCTVCSQGHSVWQCDTFRNASVAERLEIAKSKKLCFNCFKVDHSVKECLNTRTCTVPGYGEKHSNYLHQVK